MPKKTFLNLFKIGTNSSGSEVNEKDILNKIDELFKKAEECFKEKDFEQSEEYFSEILELKPNHFNSILYLGKIFFNDGKYTDSISLFKKYLNEYPNSFDAKLRLINAYVKVKEFDSALGILNQLKNTQTDPKNLAKVTGALGKVYYSQGNFYKDNAKYKEALGCYEQAGKFENDEEKNMFHIALCYKQMQKYTKAIEIFNEMLKIYEKNDKKKYNRDIYIHLGDIAEEQGNVGRAIIVYNKFVELNPKSPHNYFFSGKALLLQKNYDKAIENFKEALKHEKNLKPVYLELGKLYSIQKDYNEALNIYNELIKDDAENPEILNNIALTKIRFGEWKEACDILGKLEETPEVNKYLGKSLLELGMLEEAFEKLSLSKKTSPDDPELCSYFCQYYRKTYNMEDSKRELEKYLQTSPDNLILLKEMAQSNKENKDTESALKIYNKMLNLDPREKEPLKLIADLHRENENYKEAVKIYKEYLTIYKNDTEAIYNLALCYFEQIKMDKAIDEFEKLKDNHKYGFSASSYLCDIYISKNEVNKAWENIQKCIEYNPCYVDGYLKYGKICVSLGQHPRACEFFSYAIQLEPDNNEAIQLLKYYSQN